MNALRRTLTAMLATVALGAAALALTAGPAQAAKPAGAVAGRHVEPCRGMTALTFIVFVRGLDCDRAMRQLHRAATKDRPCPPGWRARKGVRVKLGGHRSPPVVLCTNDRRAFTWHLPVG